jgi:hypothetical protein
MHIIKNIIDMPQTVYHGTTTEHSISIQKEMRVDAGASYVDFGPGFYTTSNRRQAALWARKKTTDTVQQAYAANQVFSEIKPFLFTFQIDTQKLTHLTGLVFTEPSVKWAEFVYNNRIGNNFAVSDFHNLNHTIEYVYGPLAESRIALLTVKVLRKRITPQTFIKLLQADLPGEYDQLSFHTPLARSCLTIIGKEVITK